jgi:hypothetical protein
VVLFSFALRSRLLSIFIRFEGGLMRDDRLVDSELCPCEQPGHFHSGVPGILAEMQGGRVAPEARVERCDQCCRFESDTAALARLIELGLAAVPPAGVRPFSVHCFAVVRVKFTGLLACSAETAVRQALDRFCWETHGRSAEFADDFTGFLVDYDGDADHARSCEFDGQLNPAQQETT